VGPLARIVAELDSWVLDEGNEAFPPSNLEFTEVGTPPGATNLIPGRATARLNIRFNNLHRGTDLVDRVRQVVERHAPEAKLEVLISGEAFLTPPGALYDHLVCAIREETGIDPKLSTSGGTSDGRFLIQLCPVVDFGLPNATMHKVGEHARVDDIISLTSIYRRVLEKAFA
jgi:succinyl-diaminopimelate desuccinylase